MYLQVPFTVVAPRFLGLKPRLKFDPADAQPMWTEDSSRSPGGPTDQFLPEHLKLVGSWLLAKNDRLDGT